MLRRNENLRSDLESDFERLIDRVRRLADSADPDTFLRRPAEGSWSAAECVDHLNGTARLYLPELEEAIAGARRQGLTGDRADGRTLLGRLIAWATAPPPRLKMTTFRELEPAQHGDPAELVEEFARLHRAVIDQMNGTADLDGKRIKVRSLLDSRLKLSLDDWYAFIAAHARRHLWQAERALEQAASAAGRG